MKKIVGLKNVLSMAAVLFIFLGTSGIANGYGGGDGDGGGGEGSGDGSGGPQQIKKLSEEEIEKIFLGMNAKDKKALVEAFAGSDVTKETLIAIRNAIRESMEGRQEVREGEMASAHTEASIMNGLTLIVEGADKAGQVSQFVLHFVPGVGWVTSGALDAARGGADAYRDGKDA
ncbi:MAG: hypothetical protein JXR72_03560, partial [Proteobacteria bacterium]|nr:hypothetical protein [Pseudomonadota bacterium]